MAAPPGCITRHEAAKRCGVSARWLDDARRGTRNEGPPWVQLGGRVYYRVEDVDHFLEQQHRSTPAQTEQLPPDALWNLRAISDEKLLKMGLEEQLMAVEAEEVTPAMRNQAQHMALQLQKHPPEDRGRLLREATIQLAARLPGTFRRVPQNQRAARAALIACKVADLVQDVLDAGPPSRQQKRAAARKSKS